MLRLKDGITEKEMAKYGYIFEEYDTKNKDDVSSAYFYDSNGSVRTTIFFVERPRNRGKYYFDECGVVDWGRFGEVMENFAKMVKAGIITDEP
jgi:hypothetical protein